MYEVNFKKPLLDKFNKDNLHYSLDDFLKESSEYLEEFISCSELNRKLKSSKSLLREFDEEKWGSLKKLLNHNIEISDFERIEDGYKPIHFFLDEKHYKVKSDFFRNYLKYFNLHHISKLFSKTKFSCIVELGCGYGSKLLEIPRSISDLRKINLIGLDISKNGLDIANYFAEKYHYSLETHLFNFRNEKIRKFNFKDSLLISNYSLHYHKEFSVENIIDFVQAGFIAGIHFEPCPKLISRFCDYEYANLCEKYIYNNDYTRNISDAFLKAKDLEILNLKISKQICGNRFLPGTFIIWKKK